MSQFNTLDSLIFRWLGMVLAATGVATVRKDWGSEEMDRTCTSCGTSSSSSHKWRKSLCNSCYERQRRLSKAARPCPQCTVPHKTFVNGICNPCYMKDYRENNPDAHKQWKISNKEHLSVWRSKNHKSRYTSDPTYRLGMILRNRVNESLSDGKLGGSFVEDLGCSVSYLRAYLESKFSSGMTWANHGKYGWHIDHIQPLSGFDLTDRKKFLEACHYTNLQPLWAIDNLKKGNKRLEDLRG